MSLHNYKNLLSRLYVDENRTLGDVMEYMERGHGIHASKGVYQRLFAKWGFRKRKTGEDWIWVDHRIEKRKAAGKKSELLIKGTPLDDKKIQKEIARHVSCTAKIQATAASPKTPDGFTIVTPAGSPHQQPSDTPGPILHDCIGMGTASNFDSFSINDKAQNKKFLDRVKGRRESIPGSLVRELNWAGLVGTGREHGIETERTFPSSIPMTGLPFIFQPPTFHSSSYLPILEANFSRNFSCCGVTLPTLHDLLQHYEETHATQPFNQERRSSQDENRAALATTVVAQQQSQQHGSQGTVLQPNRTLDMYKNQSRHTPQHRGSETIDGTELDEPMVHGYTSAPRLFHWSRSSNQGRQLNPGMRPTRQSFNTSKPGTAIQTGRPISLRNNIDIPDFRLIDEWEDFVDWEDFTEWLGRSLLSFMRTETKGIDG